MSPLLIIFSVIAVYIVLSFAWSLTQALYEVWNDRKKQ